MHGLDIHALALTMREDGLHIHAHIELPSEMSIAKAHKIVSAYEHDLCKRLWAKACCLTYRTPYEIGGSLRSTSFTSIKEQVLQTLEKIRPHHKDVGELFEHRNLDHGRKCRPFIPLQDQRIKNSCGNPLHGKQNGSGNPQSFAGYRTHQHSF